MYIREKTYSLLIEGVSYNLKFRSSRTTLFCREGAGDLTHVAQWSEIALLIGLTTWSVNKMQWDRGLNTNVWSCKTADWDWWHIKPTWWLYYVFQVFSMVTTLLVFSGVYMKVLWQHTAASSVLPELSSHTLPVTQEAANTGKNKQPWIDLIFSAEDVYHMYPYWYSKKLHKHY